MARMTAKELANEAIHNEAHAAGHEAATRARPTPMQVVQRANPMDDTSPVVKAYEPVADGVCGFAWVVIRPGNSSYARHMKKHHGARAHYYGGMEVYISAYQQSYERKMAYATAYADVLRAHGIEASPGGRLD